MGCSIERGGYSHVHTIRMYVCVLLCIVGTAWLFLFKEPSDVYFVSRKIKKNLGFVEGKVVR